MYELKVRNGSGEELNFSTSKDYIVYKINGLNPPKATINSSVNATEDGTNINSSRVENRNIVLYLTIEGDVEKNRIALYKYFTPKNMVTLYFKNGTRDVHIEGIVELIECDLFTNRQIAQISIICPNTYFRSKENYTTAFSDVESWFQFPFSISKAGMPISGISTNIRKSIVYEGDVSSGIIIELFATGTVVNPIIYNVHDKTQMALNVTMQESDKIVINTNFNQKSITLVRNGVSSNALGYLVPNSAWFVLNAGDNVFTYDADSGNSYLQITFTTSLLYGGV
jgi:hypothetical protein